MSKKLEKILDQKFEKFIKGIDTLINDIKTLKEDETHKIILLRKDFEKVKNDLNSTIQTLNKYLDSIERSK